MATHPRERVRPLDVTTPANTAVGAPQSTTWNMGTGVLEKLDIVIPSGHVGLTGIQLLWGGRQVLPYEAAEWIIGNDDEITVDLGLWTGVGVLTVRTYNTDDTFAHSHHLRAYVTDLALPVALGLPPLGILPPPPLEEPPPEILPPPAWEGIFTDEELELLESLGISPEDALSILTDILDELLEHRAMMEAAVPGEPVLPPEDVAALEEELAAAQATIAELEALLATTVPAEDLAAVTARVEAVRERNVKLRERVKKLKAKKRKK